MLFLFSPSLFIAKIDQYANFHSTLKIVMPYGIQHLMKSRMNWIRKSPFRGLKLVENTGVEQVTYCMPCKFKAWFSFT